jgi:predicted RNA-binding Zn ribbon-like protein
MGFGFAVSMDAIYWHLADTVTQGNVKRCAYTGCGHVFITTNRKRRYCPRPTGVLGESLCSNRDRQREYQQRLKEAQARAKKRRRLSEKAEK